MLALQSSFASTLVTSETPPVSAPLSDVEALASRLMQFDSKGNCTTPAIARAAMSLLTSPSGKSSTKATIFRNALIGGYERWLLDWIERRLGSLNLDPALQSALKEEGFVLEQRREGLWLTRNLDTPPADSFVQMASSVLSELGMPADIVRLVTSMARLTPKEKTAAIEQYLGCDISTWTLPELNDALIAAFNAGRPLPYGSRCLEISDFTYRVPAQQICRVPAWIKLTTCRLTSGTLTFSNGTVTSIKQGANPLASGPQATSVAGVPKSRAKAWAGATAIAIAPFSSAEAEGFESIALAKVAHAAAIARQRAKAIAQAEWSTATASSGGLAVATAPNATAHVTPSQLTTDRSSVALAIGPYAGAYVGMEGAQGVATDGAEVLSGSKKATIHAYGASSATALDLGVTALRHHVKAKIFRLNGSALGDMALEPVDGKTFSRAEQLIYKLTDAQLREINDKSPEQRRTLRTLFNQEIWSSEAVMNLSQDALTMLGSEQARRLIVKKKMTVDDLSNRFHAFHCRGLRSNPMLCTLLEKSKISLSDYLGLNLSEVEKLGKLTRDKIFRAELYSLHNQRQLKSGTQDLHDLIRRHTRSCSGLLLQGGFRTEPAVIPHPLSWLWNAFAGTWGPLT